MADVEAGTRRIQVANSRPEDSGRGLAHLPRTMMAALGVSEGDVIEIVGKQSTPARAVGPYAEDEGLDIIRVDGLQRANAGVGSGDFVEVRKAESKPATRVVFAPAQQNLRLQGSSNALKRTFLGRPFCQGDIVATAGHQRVADMPPQVQRFEGVANPVKLSANENILGCSPAAKEAFLEAAADLSAYPDGRGAGLRSALAKRYRLEESRIILGSGSDEIFALLSQVFLGAGDNIVQGEFGFGAYAIAARANEAEVRLAAEPGYRIDVNAMLEQVDERTSIVWIANPANPTGTIISDAEMRRLHAGLPGNVVLVIDGAYAEFVDDPTFSDGIDLARGEANVVVTRTFSKLHGLAALRVGWAYAPEAISEAVNRIRPPFNTSIAGQVAAVAALADEDFQAKAFAHVQRWRPWLIQQLGGLGLDVAPSAANFVLVGVPKTTGSTAKAAEDFLASRGLIVRGVAGYGLPDHIRITIGLEEHNRAVIDVLTEFLRSPGGS